MYVESKDNCDNDGEQLVGVQINAIGGAEFGDVSS